MERIHPELDVTERTRQAGQTDGRTDRRTKWNQYTPQQLRCSEGIINSLCAVNFTEGWIDNIVESTSTVVQYNIARIIVLPQEDETLVRI